MTGGRKHHAGVVGDGGVAGHIGEPLAAVADIILGVAVGGAGGCLGGNAGQVAGVNMGIGLGVAADAALAGGVKGMGNQIALGTAAGANIPVIIGILAPGAGGGVTQRRAIGEGLGSLCTAGTGLIVDSGAGAGGLGFQVGRGGVHLVINVGLLQGLRLGHAADRAGINLLTGGGGGGPGGHHTGVPAMLTQVADVVMAAGGRMPVIGGVALPGGSKGVLVGGRLHLLGLGRTADRAGIGLHALGSGGGLGGNHAGVPDMVANLNLFILVLTGGRSPVLNFVVAPLVGEGVTLGLAIQEGLCANLAADAAVVVFGRAGAGSGSFQILGIGVLPVKHVLRRGGQGFALLGAADGAGVNLGALRGMGGLNGNHTGIPGVGAVVGGHVRVAAGVGVPVIVRVHRPLRAEGMAGRLTIGKGLCALFTAQAAVVIIGRAVRGSGRS